MRMPNLAPALMALFLLPMAATPGQAQDIPRVTVAQAAQMEFIGRVPITGTLVAREEVMVNPRVAGQQIIALYADIGDQVTQGQLLAELDRETLEVRLAQALAEKQRAEAGVAQAEAQVALSQASLDSARTNFERERALLRSGTITQAKFDQSETAFKTAQASHNAAQQGLAVAKAAVEQAAIQARLAELNLSYTRIVAPSAGVISSRNASVGAVANPGPKPLFQIIRDNQIEVRTEVIETDISRIHIGDETILRIAGLGEIAAKVRLISPRVDPRSRLGEVRISLADDASFKIGIFASGWISTEQYQAVGVPVSAILSDGKGDFTQIVDEEGVVHLRRLETGLVWNGMREVRAGLKPGDTVILLAGAFFREGDRIVPVQTNGVSQ
jgi:multidrug efflux pump subunit AcrA (membrane-fusion protein)